MTNVIKHQFFFSHPPKAVWDYLTKPELMKLWLMKTDFEPIVGHDFTFTAGPMPALEFDGIIYCKVLIVEPLKRLSYSWKTGPGDGTIKVDSVVLWRLEEKEDGTELLLEHSGISSVDNVNMYNALNGGWQGNIKKIADLLNGVTNGATKA